MLFYIIIIIINVALIGANIANLTQLEREWLEAKAVGVLSVISILASIFCILISIWLLLR